MIVICFRPRCWHHPPAPVGRPPGRPAPGWPTTPQREAVEDARVIPVAPGVLHRRACRPPRPLRPAPAVAELGLGAGWCECEHRGLGIPFPSTSERFERLEEQLAILSGLWSTPTGEYFSYRGKHYHLDDCSNFPVHAPARADGTAPGAGAPGFPPHRPRPRVIVGGVGRKRTPSLAARFADELNTGFRDGLAERLANFRRICAASGRLPGRRQRLTAIPRLSSISQTR